MKNRSSPQLDLLSSPSSTAKGNQARPQLVVELDHRAWMAFLNEEWLIPEPGDSFLLGVDSSNTAVRPADRMVVAVWIDPNKLPACDVTVLRGASWRSMPLSELASTDTAVSWDYALPLFAVNHFTVETIEFRAHLLAMIRNFADIERPLQPLEIGKPKKSSVPPGEFPRSRTNNIPAHWDALRGAASMALMSVPAIGPWLDLLSQLLSNQTVPNAASVVHAPWLQRAFWSLNSESQDHQIPLWQAMMEEFSRPGLLREWRPEQLLDNICSRSRQLGESEERLDGLVDATMLLLQDRMTIQDAGLKQDSLGLALQLVLLRPTPERFSGWKDDWPAMPPGAWWTGAILTGFLSGYRALPLQLRGPAPARKQLALRVLHLAGGDHAHAAGSVKPSPVNWSVEGDTVALRAGGDLLVEHKFSNRGRWYEVNLDEPDNREEAKVMAEQFCPQWIRKALVLEDGEFKLRGNGFAKFDDSHMTLRVNGRLELDTGAKLTLASQLNEEGFRNWLATAPISTRLPRPRAIAAGEDLQSDIPLTVDIAPKINTKRPPSKNTVSKSQSLSKPPEGLSVIADFVKPDEEVSLLKAIDAMPWDDAMSRRVQHYGWRYDYKAKKVNSSAYLGPLPDWANDLGLRLFNQGLIKEVPDQVIVNEYVGPQGITKHIDCVPCFRGAVVTISLNESWEMIFSRQSTASIAEKYKVLLERGSAAILDGEARSQWLHEIPKRQKELGKPRGRRVSITFRKVNSDR